MSSVLVARSARALRMCPRHSVQAVVESCASEEGNTKTAMKFHVAINARDIRIFL